MRSNLLSGLPVFSSSADRVYQAILAVEPEDPRVKLFARRSARAITRFGINSTEKRRGPLESFVLCGTNFSSIPLLVRTLAESWLGTPWDDAYPFTYVDCSAFSTPYPGLLQQLVGPLPPDASGASNMPLFGSVELPAFKARRGGDLKMLQEWNDDFAKKRRDRIEKLGPRITEFLQRFRMLIYDQWEKLREDEIKQNGPFGSVIFFDAVDRSSQPLRELILQIIRNGALTLGSGTRVDFSSSIIILSIYREDNLLHRGDLGFSGVSPQLSNAGGEYEKVRRNLLNDPATGSLVRSVAENLIIVSERTSRSQSQRIHEALQAFARSFEELGVNISFSEDFVSGFVEDTREHVSDRSAPTIYTEERIASGLRRHVLDPMCRILLFRKVNSGSKLRFDRDAGDEFFVAVSMECQGDGDVIDVEKLTASAGVPSIRGLEMPDWLKGLDERIRALLR